jgi:hypothetical protein
LLERFQVMIQVQRRIDFWQRATAHGTGDWWLVIGEAANDQKKLIAGR